MYPARTEYSNVYVQQASSNGIRQKCWSVMQSCCFAFTF